MLVMAACWVLNIGLSLWHPDKHGHWIGLVLRINVAIAFLLGYLLDRYQHRRYAPSNAGGGGVRIRSKEDGSLLAHVRADSLANADLAGACLARANLARADLRGARLEGAVLDEAVLTGADLRGASLREAHLSRASLQEADLRGADLHGARLDGTTLIDAVLHGADLTGADLRPRREGTETQLRWADLRGARFDATTRWPEGFRPERRGCVPTGIEVTPAPAPEGGESEATPAG